MSFKRTDRLHETHWKFRSEDLGLDYIYDSLSYRVVVFPADVLCYFRVVTQYETTFEHTVSSRLFSWV